MQGVPDAALGRGRSHLLPCTRAALTWATGQASTSAAISTLFVPLPKPLQPSDPGFPLGKSPPAPTPQSWLLPSPQELLYSPYLQKLHSVPCKPTLTFSSKSFSRSWMTIPALPCVCRPVPIAMENHGANTAQTGSSRRKSAGLTQVSYI